MVFLELLVDSDEWCLIKLGMESKKALKFRETTLLNNNCNTVVYVYPGMQRI